MKASVIALVPMRHHSERVPGKNYRRFAGKKLYQHVVSSLVNCEYVKEVVIDTDSPVITEDVLENFPGVRLLERPEHLRSGTISMNDIILHDVAQLESDFFLQTHSTNPLLSTETICKAIETFFENYPSFDSLFSVTRIQKRLWDCKSQAVNHDPSVLLRTQDLPALYEENSCIYIFERETLLSRKNRIGERPLLFEMDPMEAWDIDNEVDFIVGEKLYACREQSAKDR